MLAQLVQSVPARQAGQTALWAGQSVPACEQAGLLTELVQFCTSSASRSGCLPSWYRTVSAQQAGRAACRAGTELSQLSKQVGLLSNGAELYQLSKQVGLVAELVRSYTSSASRSPYLPSWYRAVPAQRQVGLLAELVSLVNRPEPAVTLPSRGEG
ncbi:hypothetical protein PCANC_19576 [Puccinia coronata f. sp. avenae]|uniref:Uncharacterized protein n=1 Tax=Puccinia coronata f. sp. avenae TaxID=200324 RepID=A0A2N5URK7_9BASI|nr:hypothetical protein PCANC_19093 [Puccinia coronata f. sp. avenae]PLW40390.1 hypothetical protein PCANC_19576 [Puccinia coronata f. sp. avenae]